MSLQPRAASSAQTFLPFDRGVIVEVHTHDEGRADRLLSLGVTPGASVTMLQTFPGVVFLCDQTELAVERRVANTILVRLQETRP